MHKGTRWLLLSALLLIIGLPVTQSQDSETFKIGALVKNLDNPFFERMVTGYEFAAERYGIDIVIGSTATEADIDQQLTTLQGWLAEGDFDGFIVTPFRSDNLTPGLAVATEAGIPIINTDELIPESERDSAGIAVETQIASNNVRAGTVAAQYLIDTLAAGTEVAVIEGAVGTQSSIDRVTGFIRTAEEGGLRVVASIPANWDTDEAYDVATDLLNRYADVGAFFAANDGMALGVIRALEDAGRTEAVEVLSVDAIPEALAAVEAGTLTGTVAQFPEEMAVLAVEAMLKVLDERPIAPEIESPVVLITADNLAASGVQLGDPALPDYQIGALTKNRDNGFFLDMIAGYEQAAADYDLPIDVFSTATEADIDQQLTTFDDWLTAGTYAGFAVTPFRSDNLIPALAAASDTGLPVVNLDELIPPDLAADAGIEIAAQVASNNVRAGTLAADYLLDALAEGAEVAVIEGAVGTQSSIDRVTGFINTAASGGLRVVASIPANWDTDEAYTVATDLLDRYPDLQAFFTANDGMALGVIRALEDADRTGDVQILSVDAIPEALEAIEAGTLTGTVAQFPDEMAYLAVETLIKVIEGRPVAPFIESPVVLLTADNLPD